MPQIALPVFGYKSHISIDRKFGFIRGSTVTSAADADGRQLRHVLRKDNTASDVWADSAYRSQSNEKWLASNMLTSQIHRRKPAGKPMPMATSRANAKKSSIRARVEHVFAHQKNRYSLFIRTIGLARAETKLTLANLAYNFDRLIFHERRSAMACVCLKGRKQIKYHRKQRNQRCNEPWLSVMTKFQRLNYWVFAGLQLTERFNLQ